MSYRRRRSSQKEVSKTIWYEKHLHVIFNNTADWNDSEDIQLR